MKRKSIEESNILLLNPKLAVEFDVAKNGIGPDKIRPSSKEKYWWKCEVGHEWIATVRDRHYSETKCTECNYGYFIRERNNIYNEDGTEKICKKCEKMLPLNQYRTRRKDNQCYENNICLSCDNLLVSDYRMTDIGIAAEIVRRTKYAAKKDGLAFDLDKEWIFQRLNDIQWKCELTGLDMVKQRDRLEKGNGFIWNSLSIDKIIPKNGYVKSNVRFVLLQINIFKQNGNDSTMYMLAEALLDHRNSGDI